ncbi:MAG: hypothetical protein FRX49_02703 [Trebouxia sp. A1-2]|nr:MAG: hypothetical protein FRX49_02703 [Trebouxia sp. A1-2]
MTNNIKTKRCIVKAAHKRNNGVTITDNKVSTVSTTLNTAKACMLSMTQAFIYLLTELVSVCSRGDIRYTPAVKRTN